MDITKDNFEVTLALIEDTIVRWADFIAIDLELSGVETCASKNHYLDTVSERYKRIVANAPDFIVIQFGLCAFKHDSTTNSYLARPFNFALFPHCFRSIDKRFMCQASALQFLAKNNFDFNKLIYKGIPYLSRFQEELLRKKGPVMSPAPKSPLPLRDSDIAFLSNIWEVLENWDQEGKSETCISLPISSGYHRRLVYQELPKRYPNFVLDTIDVSGGRHLRISVADKSTAKDRLEKDLQQNIGFRKVIDLLVDAKKRIVGHNMFVDLIMLFQQFEAPLPDTADTFKSKMLQLFPNVVDTKYMASKCSKVQTTNLEELYGFMCRSPFEVPFIGLDSGFRNYVNGTRFHEAGFDAYATGIVYLKLRPNVGAKVLNMIPIPRSDSILTLDGPDLVPDRSCVFHVFGLPDFNRQVQEEMLVRQFNQYGSISITWLDDFSAFISVEGPNGTLDSKTRDEVLALRQYKITTYAQYQSNNVPEKRITVSMIDEERMAVADLQEIHVQDSYDDTSDSRNYNYQNGFVPLQFCGLL